MSQTGKSLYSQLILLGFTAGGPVFSFVSGLHRSSDSSLCTELTAERGHRFLYVDDKCYDTDTSAGTAGKTQLKKHVLLMVTEGFSFVHIGTFKVLPFFL